MNSTILLTAFVSYVVFLIWLSYAVNKKQQQGAEDFLLAGRSLPLFLTLGTTVATMVGTGSSMGAVGFAYQNGWAGTLYGIGGAAGILLTALWFAPVRKLNFMTMSEELAYYVGANKIVKNSVAILIFFASIGWLGAHILGGGLYLAWLIDIDSNTAKIIIALSFSVYVVVGGYRAVVWTDTLQALILFFGFLLMSIYAVNESGGLAQILSVQPKENISFLSTEKIGILPAISLAAVVAVGVLATPSFRQRIYSAKDVNSCKKSFYLSGGLYLLFSFIPALIGMAAFAINPDLDNRNYAFPFLAIQVLPIALSAIVLIAGLSATMSSASSDAVAGVSILMRDIYMIIFGKVPSHHVSVMYSRIALIGVIALALTFSLFSNDIINYITKMVSTVLSGMFVCALLGKFWIRYNWQGAIASLVAGSASSFYVLMSEELLSQWGNPVIPAVFCSLTAGILVSLLTPKNHISPAQAHEILNNERRLMETTPGAKQ